MKRIDRTVLCAATLAAAAALTLGAAALASGLDCFGVNCIKQPCFGPCESMGARNCTAGKVVCCCRPMGAWECKCCDPGTNCGCGSPNCCYSSC